LKSLSRSRGFFNRNERRIDDTVLRFVADRLLVELGCDRITANPFDFMDMFHCRKNNFFEKKVADTKKTGVMNTMKKHKNNIRR
jgi:ribonucleotide reductase beta subunit family protein with ferritin-like domain